MSNKFKQLTRVRQIIQREQKFIFNAEFERSSAEIQILHTGTSQGTARRLEKVPSDVPAHLRHLWEIPLLTVEEETDLFRRMNYLKYRSNVLWSRLNPDHPNVPNMDEIERMLSEATEIRNHIVQANTRLVVSIARRFKNASDALDEMISTGNLVLIKTVERFDYSRGFRFSTYATHSVKRELYRTSSQLQKVRLTEVSTAPENLESVEARRDWRAYEEHDRRVDYIRSLLMKVLPEREHQVVISRYGLDSGSGQTLREVAESMGLSQERIRQLQIRAVDRLQGLALNDIADSVFSAEIVGSGNDS